jgi:phytoene dehydrogenase-like protein
MALVNALGEVVEKYGGKMILNTAIEKIIVEDNKVNGVIAPDGKTYEAEVVIASGGAKELFLELVGKDLLPKEYLEKHISPLFTTESVFMVHLGVDYDPSIHQNGAALSYYYLTYDVDHGIEYCMEGNYHKGEHGFVVYIPSKHSPEMAPPGHHAVTIYTIAPNFPKNIDWEKDKDRLAEKLLEIAEKLIPGLREHEKTRYIITPNDFRKITHLNKHAFGGTVPHMKVPPPPHETPIEGLWFVGAQSENFGGVTGAMTGAEKVVKQILKGPDTAKKSNIYI